MSSVFVDPQVLDDRFTQGFCLPQTFLPANAELVVASLRLAEGWRAELGLLAMHFVGIDTAEVPVKISGNMHLAFVGLYQGSGGVHSNLGRPIAYVGRDVPSYGDTHPFGLFPLFEPGVYTVLLVNNTSNADLQVAVNGAFRLARL